MGSYLFNIIESLQPGSFTGIGNSDGMKMNYLLYFSVSNLLTLGLGDIVPVSELVKKLVMFTGLLGHFYTVFVTSIIIGKYIQQKENRG